MASGETFVRVAAFHPNWRGILRLAVPGDAIFHERAGSTGKYRRASGKLTVIWDDYQPDVFFEQNGRFIHEAFVRGAPPIEQIVAAGVGGQPVVATRLSVVVPGTGYEVMLRLGTSDSDTFEQIFIAGDYDSPNLPDNAATIVDLGANIGLATVFFGLRFPQARILAVEPDAGNAAVLATNTAALGDRVRVCRAAVWVTDGIVNLHTESTDGTTLGAWGIQVSDRIEGRSGTVTCRTLPTLLRQAGIETVDILKVDIERAERELFSHGAADWLSNVNLIVIETHDRFRPGSEAAVRQALDRRFAERPPRGENLFFRRLGS